MMAEQEDGGGGQGDEGEQDTLKYVAAWIWKASNTAICDGTTIF